jgi:hypothetical protein
MLHARPAPLSHCLIAAAAFFLLPASASASSSAEFSALGPAVAESLKEFSLSSQGQIGLAGALSDWKHPGGVSLRSSVSFFGFGLGGALRYERVNERHGATLGIAGHFRPLGLLGTRLYRFLDPYVSLGIEAGAGEREWFRAAAYVGLGLDVGLFPSLKTHPALVLEYQVRPFRTPSDMPLQVLHIGGAVRTVF